MSLSSYASPSASCQRGQPSAAASLQRLLAAALAALAVSAAACSAERRDFADRGAGGAGGASGSGAGAGMGGEGAASSGGSCTRPSDCPAPEEPCQIAACVDGRCGTAPLPPGTEVERVDGDCKRILCDEDGSTYVIPADEPPDDGNQCTEDSCDETEPMHVVRLDEECSHGFCDEDGNCCDDAGNCCNEPDGCESAEECVDDDDCGPPDECHEHVCVEGRCIDKHYPEGEPCHDGVDQCDGHDECVDCVSNDGCLHDCPSGGVCLCVDNACISAS